MKLLIAVVFLLIAWLLPQVAKRAQRLARLRPDARLKNAPGSSQAGGKWLANQAPAVVVAHARAGHVSLCCSPGQ